MNLSTLIKQYFNASNGDVTIDVFDEHNIYNVYQHVVSVLTQHLDIEVTVLQAMSYCFYEMLDNVLIHSGKDLGTIVYMQLRTDVEIDPAKVVAFRTNVAEQYNEAFLNDNELETLW